MHIISRFNLAFRCLTRWINFQKLAEHMARNMEHIDGALQAVKRVGEELENVKKYIASIKTLETAKKRKNFIGPIDYETRVAELGEKSSRVVNIVNAAKRCKLIKEQAEEAQRRIDELLNEAQCAVSRAAISAAAACPVGNAAANRRRTFESVPNQ